MLPDAPAAFRGTKASKTLEEPMIKIVLAVIISTLSSWALPVTAFAAERNSAQQSKKTADTKGQMNTKTQAKPCAEYGEGYRRVEGTSTCVKIGGYVRFQTGQSR